MPPVGPTVRLGVNVLAVVATALLAGLLWRRRSEPTARPLLGLSVVLLVASAAHLALTEVLAAADGWVLSAFNFTAVAMCLWFRFSVRYTGRGKRVTWLAAVLLVAVPAVVASISLVAVTARPELMPYVDAVLGVVMLLVTSIVVVGVFFVVSESTGENAFPFRESLLLSGGAAALALSPLAVSIFVAPLAVPVSLSLASGLFAVTVHRYPLFETLPVARVAGRDRVIDEMADAVVVVDMESDVRDLNAAAERIFGVDRDGTLDRPLTSALPAVPDPDGIVDGDDPTRVRTDGGRELAVTANRVTDARDRRVGYLLVCQDVTDRRNRERRLSVLNQLLVGAVRERMTAVAADADRILDATDAPEDGDPDPAAVGDRIWTTTTDLTRLVTHAREIERSLSDGDGTATADVRAAVEAVVDGADGEGVHVATDLPDDPVAVGVDGAILRTVLELLVSDPRSRATSEVSIAVEDAPREVRVHVVHGPEPAPGTGVDEASDETSGPGAERGGASDPPVAVRMARLVVDHVGGGVSVSTGDAGERRIVVELPTPEPANAVRGPVHDGGEQS